MKISCVCFLLFFFLFFFLTLMTDPLAPRPANLAKEIVAFYDYTQLNLLLMALVGFFRSSWMQIRSNAAIAAAYLLFYLTEEGKRRVNLEHVVSALISLLREQDPKVRANCAKALSVLWEC